MPSANTMRRLRREAHRYFDPLWRGVAKRDGVANHKARTRAYRWLRKQLKLSPHQCHFSQMDHRQLRQAIALCKQFYPTHEKNN